MNNIDMDHMRSELLCPYYCERESHTQQKFTHSKHQIETLPLCKPLNSCSLLLNFIFSFDKHIILVLGATMPSSPTSYPFNFLFCHALHFLCFHKTLFFSIHLYKLAIIVSFNITSR